MILCLQFIDLSRSLGCANFTQTDQILSSLLRLVPYGTLGQERVKVGYRNYRAH